MLSSTKPDFDRSEREATRLLLYQNNINSLSVDVQSLRYDKRIIFDSIQNYCAIVNEDISKFDIKDILQDGCTLIADDVYIVLYNDEVSLLSPERLNWTLAHEVGHIYLGHTQNGRKEEIEAHWFAAQLLMPEYVIRHMKQRFGFINIEDLIACFNVSIDAAINRLRSIARKRTRELLPDEEKVLARYMPFIDDYYELKEREIYDFVMGG